MQKNLNFEALVFVYNADSGFFSVVSDFAHKIISPETYACSLCKLTYGNFTIKKGWKEFIEGLEIRKEFLHKDEFNKKYPNFQNQQFPAILALRDGKLSEVMGAGELNNLNSLDSLKNALTQRLAQ